MIRGGGIGHSKKIPPKINAQSQVRKMTWGRAQRTKNQFSDRSKGRVRDIVPRTATRGGKKIDTTQGPPRIRRMGGGKGQFPLKAGNKPKEQK